MFRNYDEDNPTRDQVDIQIQAHGGSIVLIQRGKRGGPFRHRPLSRYNRRITGTTPMRLDGPAAGDDLLKTSQDPSGRRVRGMLNNCAGGVTPWGTVLTGEENFDQYFGNLEQVTDPRIRALHDRYGFAEGPIGPQVGALPRPLRPGQGAQRAAPLRLGGRDRPLRPGLHPAQAHRPWPDQARVRDHQPDQEQAGGRLHRRRRDLRVLLQVRHQGPLPLVGPQAQPGPARRGHPARGQAARRRHRRVDPAAPRRGPAHGRQRLRQPGRGADQHQGLGRRGRRDQDGPPRGHPAQPGDRAGLRQPDQQHLPDRARPRQPALPQPLRARAGAARGRRRRGGDLLHLADLPALRRPGRPRHLLRRLPQGARSARSAHPTT